jgi:hypothetical protein
MEELKGPGTMNRSGGEQYGPRRKFLILAK